MYKIMIIEDDSGLSAAIKQQLEVWGYEAVCTKNFQRVTEEFYSAIHIWCLWI